MRASTSATGTAPGSIDFLGGVADYSGALVLQKVISAQTQVELTSLAEPLLRLHSSEGEVELNSAPLWEGIHAKASNAQFCKILAESDAPGWAVFPLGCLILFCAESGWRPTQAGLEFKITSDIPRTEGLSSSAALEIATLRALAVLSGISFPDTVLARLGQSAENEIVGATCGLMDQLTVAHGLTDHLLPILCRPDRFLPPLPVPQNLLIVAWLSGHKPTFTGSPYSTVRAASFIGKRCSEAILGRKLKYVAEMTPSQFTRVAEGLPETLLGADYLERQQLTDDPLSRVAADKQYPVRAATRFAVQENHRCEVARLLLSQCNGAVMPVENSTLLGELMLQSHMDYAALGLSAAEPDAFVEAVMALGPVNGFYGARLSGSGSGDTIVCLIERDALPQLEALAKAQAELLKRPAMTLIS